MKKPASTLKSAAEAVTSTGHEILQPLRAKNSATQNTDIQKKKHPGLNLAFKDGINASRKVSNSGVTAVSVTCVGNTDDGKISKSMSESLSSIPSERAKVGKWANSMAAKSQLKPSVPPNTCNADPGWLELFDDDDDNVSEDLDFDNNLTRCRGAQGVVHIFEAINGAPRGRKCALLAISVEELEPEEQCKMQEDPEADEDAEYQDAEGDVHMMDEQGNLKDSIGLQNNESQSAHNFCRVELTDMLVGVVETANSNKPIKTETGQLPRSRNIKKGKLKNVHLPIGAWNSEWCSKFIPTVMYWIGNSNFSWTIPDDTLSNLLHNIYYSVYKQPGDFEVDGSNGTFNVNFGSTATTILMVFFAWTDEYKMLETRKAYSEYQLKDSRFVYEDPDSEDSPGAFLSEFILHIFAAHLNVIQGHQLIDTLDIGLPGYQTALALTTATAEHALILARDDLIIENTSDHGKHKIALTLNQATNKMSNTGTTFSAGNWETDTLAYMEWIKELPFNHVKEIVERSQP
ncbi:uncharacterized protein EDB93DRAFT_1248520 [Suillus bovinus]|uniref:uncharacterized protein n=1 Tax=Suillus bovinus TaxID=48563 RepID=UPI001B86EB2F|nr:uncharacterized protein EDB93DRAFT_1248520 [Suillus bovinus]KAG2154320.1 hypothetical protein EDB93DRAFT_1248520 [Suillus bovinus]